MFINGSRSANPTDASENRRKPKRSELVSALRLPVLLAFAYLFFWIVPPMHMSDPWYEAFGLVGKGMLSRDTISGRQLVEKGGVELRALSTKYPFHARVHYFLGCYYECAGQYDSAIIQAKEAIRLGSGSVVNQVDGLAQNLLASATAKKAAARLSLSDTMP